jgi:LacI family transcriptional regulator
VDKGRTLRDVAESLGVSVATVSRALAGHEQIAVKTRERVARAVEELGYVPNRAAQALASGRTGFAGFVLPMRGRGLVDPFLGEFVAGLTEGFGAHGMDLVLATVPRETPEERVFRTLIDAGRVDGFVVSRIAEDDARLRMLMARGVPFVAHGRMIDAPMPFAWVDTDGAASFGEAFEMLHALGHRDFALLTIDEPMTFRRLREEGLRAAIARRGDPEVRLRVVTTPRYDPARRAEAVARLVSGADRPTAVIALFDGLAIEVLQAAARAGLDVPRDLSVVGFDNIPPAAVAPPGLTTFDARIGACAAEIAEILVTVLRAKPEVPPTRLIRPEPVLRASHGPAPQRLST